jgi:hypothetical protein
LEDLILDARAMLKSFLKEIGWGSVGWTLLAQGRDQWLALVNTVMVLGVCNTIPTLHFWGMKLWSPKPRVLFLTIFLWSEGVKTSDIYERITVRFGQLFVFRLRSRSISVSVTTVELEQKKIVMMAVFWVIAPCVSEVLAASIIRAMSDRLDDGGSKDL